MPCSLPVNITIAKSVFRGLGRVHGFVNDDTGAIINTGAKYRSLLIANTSGFATTEKRLRFYSVNLEHAQSEANGEIFNASFVNIYSLKGEGNIPLLWVRGGGHSQNVSMLASPCSRYRSLSTLHSLPTLRSAPRPCSGLMLMSESPPRLPCSWTTVTASPITGLQQEARARGRIISPILAKN